MDIFTRIKSLCDENKISPSRLGIELGFSKDTISSWKKQSPSVDRVALVADYFDVSVDYMLGRSDNPKVDNRHEIITTTDEKTNLIDASPEEMAAIRAFLRAYREEKER